MRLILGSIFFISLLFGEYEVDIDFSIDKTNPYLKEGVILDVNITQRDNSCVMFFKFSPKKSRDYSFKLLSFIENEEYHNLKHQYRYIIYPLKSGKVNLEFDFIKSITTDEKVAYAISGDRDNVKALSKQDIEVELDPIELNVKKLPKGTNLVGDFSLSYKLDKNSSTPYEPIYLDIKLEGEGYLEKFDIIKEKKGYTLFKQIKESDNGIYWEYALVGQKSFKIDEVLLKAFNPKDKKEYTLKIPEIEIDIKEENISKTKIEKSRESKSFNFSYILTILSYIGVFILGLIFPKDLIYKLKKEENSFREKVKSAKDIKELLKILILEDREKYSKIIEKLEVNIYQNKSIELEEIKREILKKSLF
jgi:hypothetical protein